MQKLEESSIKLCRSFVLFPYKAYLQIPNHITYHVLQLPYNSPVLIFLEQKLSVVLFYSLIFPYSFMAVGNKFTFIDGMSLEDLENLSTCVNTRIKRLKQTAKAPNLLSSVSEHGSTESVSNGNGNSEVMRKKDFVHIERVDGKPTNVVQGLELYTGVFNDKEQEEIVQLVSKLQQKGKKGQLKGRTYSEQPIWKRGKAGASMQFGSTYAEDKHGNGQFVLTENEVEPLPPRLEEMVETLRHWGILPPTCVPNSCLVNIFDTGDTVPHIHHHNFLRPIFIVSLESPCNLLCGWHEKSPGQISSPMSIPLPVGSVLVLDGNAADVAKRCVPRVSSKRISITFREMPMHTRDQPDNQVDNTQSPDALAVGA